MPISSASPSSPPEQPLSIPARRPSAALVRHQFNGLVLPLCYATFDGEIAQLAGEAYPESKHRIAKERQ